MPENRDFDPIGQTMPRFFQLVLQKVPLMTASPSIDDVNNSKDKLEPVPREFWHSPLTFLKFVILQNSFRHQHWHPSLRSHMKLTGTLQQIIPSISVISRRVRSVSASRDPGGRLPISGRPAAAAADGGLGGGNDCVVCCACLSSSSKSSRQPARAISHHRQQYQWRLRSRISSSFFWSILCTARKSN